MNIYDTVTADSLQENDQILVNDDPIEVDYVVDEGDSIQIHGFSHLTGDYVTTSLEPLERVSLWAV